MLIGLYFGSFNPVHNGHLIIASHILNTGLADEIWFVVSPQNPFKNSAGLLNQNHRLHLVQVAIDGEINMKASNIEFKLPKPSYTITTLTYLQEKYSKQQFAIVMGSDGFQNIGKWKNAEAILNNYQIIIYRRPGFVINEQQPERIHIVDAPLLEISSTHIRTLIREKKSIRYLVPDAVKKEIEEENYYASSLENPTK